MLKKDVGFFLNKAIYPCKRRGLDRGGNCLPPDSTCFLCCSETNLLQAPALPRSQWHISFRAPLAVSESGTTLQSSHLRLRSLPHLDRFSGPRRASAIPTPGSCQLPPPPQPLGCPLLWGLDAEENENIPRPLPCVSGINPHTVSLAGSLLTHGWGRRPTVLTVGTSGLH